MLNIYKPHAYKSVHCEKYKSPDEYILFNEHSKVLKTIKVKLPNPPPLDEIEGFGLPPKEQKWKPPEMPLRLAELEINFNTSDDITDFLEKNAYEYATEIKWIKTQWDRRINGHWVYINGKPTYIDGWHYFYCGYWHLDTGLPSYRSRDRQFFLFARFCWTDTCTPDGTDLQRRVCLGFNYPKHRREGATFKAACINYELVSRYPSVHGGIQSLDDISAGKVFVDKVVNPWKKLPFFFRPSYRGNTAPQRKLVFDVHISMSGIQGSALVKKAGLNSYIDFAGTSHRSFYDGDKLIFYHDDETGKTKSESVYKRHEVTRKCLVQGNSRSIHGLTIKTSTVGEMEGDGGKRFYDLCKDSMWDERNENGMTVTGLYNLFIPAFDGLDDFIDIFGNSIIDDPKESDLWAIPKPTRDTKGNLIGAKRYLENQRISYLKSGDDDPDAQMKYEEDVRQFPFDFDECFISAGTGSGLNLVKIVNRMKELQFNKNITRTGNFRWLSKDGKVVWVDANDGRWKLSLSIDETKHQQKYKTKIWEEDGYVDTWAPKFPNVFTASADPYQFLKTEGNRLSKGGGAVFWHQDKEIDPDEKIRSEWQSHRTVCTYLSRPADPDEFSEDMLKMTVYFGAMMYPEINIPIIWHHFKRRGYLGYLKYYVDANGRRKNTPGFYTKGEMQQRIFYEHKKFIELDCEREHHIEILEQCYSIKGVEELTDHDLFVAVAGAYMGAEIRIDERKLPHNRKSNSLNSFVKAKYY
jgi:hypothetical protein